MRPNNKLILIFLIGCSGEGSIDNGKHSVTIETGSTATEDSGLIETGDGSTTTATTDNNCLDFEDGTLFGAGYNGSSVTLWDGAVVSVVEEGTNFSGLNGEEMVLMPGRFSLVIRSSDAGEVSSYGIASTPMNWLDSPVFSWLQMSEVTEDGIWLALDVIDIDGYVLGSLELPVVTGGHQAGLLEGQPEVEGLDLINGPGSPGDFVKQSIDVSEWVGEQVSFVFYQHTRIEGHGFFTLLDELCQSDNLGDSELLEFGEPDDWGL